MTVLAPTAPCRFTLDLDLDLRLKRRSEHGSAIASCLHLLRVNGPRLGPTRRSHAEAWVEQALAAWGLVPALGGRWLAGADKHLHVPGPLTLSAEYDPDDLIFSLELWHEQRRIYGIDDWLG